jgi:hypothetical protein
VDLPLLNQQRNLDQLQQRRADLEQEFRLERNLTIGEPRFLGAAAVVVALETAQPEVEAGREPLVCETHTPETVSNWGYPPLGQRVEEGSPLWGKVLALHRHRGGNRCAPVGSHPKPGDALSDG